MGLVLACAGSPGPRIQTGPDAVVTFDGLHQVDGVPQGTLFMKRNYAFGTYEKFALGEILVTIKPGARVLDRHELEEVNARFDAVAREVIVETGRTEVPQGGPCVARVNLAFLNLDLADLRPGSGADATWIASFGSMTVVLEIRDGYTDEALLRYARGASLGGGRGVGADPATGAALTAAFQEFAEDFRGDFERALPRLAPTSRALTCQQRAGLAPFTPEADARRELEEVLSLSPDPAAGRKVYATCAGCHQPTGGGLVDGSVPRLAGQHRKVIIKQLSDIRAGLRDNPTMYSFAYESRIGGAQAIADVADYIGSLEIRGDTGRGPGHDLERGGEIYASRCARCHGPDAQGDGDRYIPRIQSQHYAYLVRQFQWIKDGSRRNADPEMATVVADLAPREIDAVLDYVSRLAPRESPSSHASASTRATAARLRGLAGRPPGRKLPMSRTNSATHAARPMSIVPLERDASRGSS
jgi:cytochrome c553